MDKRMPPPVVYYLTRLLRKRVDKSFRKPYIILDGSDQLSAVSFPPKYKEHHDNYCKLW